MIRNIIDKIITGFNKQNIVQKIGQGMALGFLTIILWLNIYLRLTASNDTINDANIMTEIIKIGMIEDDSLTGYAIKRHIGGTRTYINDFNFKNNDKDQVLTFFLTNIKKNEWEMVEEKGNEYIFKKDKMVLRLKYGDGIWTETISDKD